MARRPAFQVSLAGSNDLVTWKHIPADLGTHMPAGLEAPHQDLRTGNGLLGADQPTIKATPGGGYVIAWEQQTYRAARTGGRIDSNVAMAFFPNQAALFTGRAQGRPLVLRRRLSRAYSDKHHFHIVGGNEGTPVILNIQWHGSIAKSTITLGYHFRTGVRYLSPHSHQRAKLYSVDREAQGTVVNFQRWKAVSVLNGLTREFRLQLHYFGGFGTFRPITYGTHYRLYEALPAPSSTVNDTRLVLDDERAGRLVPLTTNKPQTSQGIPFGAPGIPTPQILPSPDGTSMVLDSNLFVYGGPGEISYLNKLKNPPPGG